MDAGDFADGRKVKPDWGANWVRLTSRSSGECWDEGLTVGESVCIRRTRQETLSELTLRFDSINDCLLTWSQSKLLITSHTTTLFLNSSDQTSAGLRLNKVKCPSGLLLLSLWWLFYTNCIIFYFMWYRCFQGEWYKNNNNRVVMATKTIAVTPSSTGRPFKFAGASLWCLCMSESAET